MKLVITPLLIKIVISIAIAGAIGILYWHLSLYDIWYVPRWRHMIGFFIIVYAIQVIYDTYLTFIFNNVMSSDGNKKVKS